VPVTIEWPNENQPKKKSSHRLLILLAILAVLFLCSRTLLSLWVDQLWFDSLGYGQVFWRSRELEWGSFAFFGLATFVLLYAVFRLLLRAHTADLPSDHTVYMNGRPVVFSLRPVLKLAGLGVALAVGFLTALAISGEWMTLARYYYAPASSASPDPIFGQPLNFYLFTLPVWNLLSGWLLSLTVISTLMAAVFLMIAGGSSALREKSLGRMVLPMRGVSICVAMLLTIVALRVYLSRYDLLFTHHTIFDGVTYTDAHVYLLGKLCLSVLLLLGALIAAFNAVRKPGVMLLAASIVPAALCLVLTGVIGWYVGVFIVKPNEMVREQPYISYNIAATRQAFGLDRFSQHEFPAETDVEATDPQHNQATLQNIRLWDLNALQDTLRQQQEIRTYYDFPDVDIDRYIIDGAPREVMLAARELNVEKLPQSSRNWINEKLIYTHGYGVTMNPVNGFTSEGLPTLYLSNMPVQSTTASLRVTRPEIYFGEMTDTDIYVRTHQLEFNYAQGDSNNLSSYEGSGGIELGGFLRRILLALDRGDLTKLPFSDDISAQSRLLMRRNVRERVAELAPFLSFDQDPYLVVGEDGRLRWMMDAFTSSDSYPYATHYHADHHAVNYMRNSVKAVIDAYDGTVTFYVFDAQDPILATWRAIFPDLFKDAATMPANLRQHVRYPERLLKLQAEAYGLYHMTNPSVFYNREDLWTVATENAGQGEEQSAQSMQPNFVLMRLPEENSVEFVEMLPFTPSNRNNLIGWIAARSDGDNYGKAVVYNFPKSRMVDGPQQIEARIDQNAQLSGQLTLWNQQGSHVQRGTLLVIPSGKALLYAEPIYLKADRSPMPELRLVVLALQDKLAYGPSFESALTALFGNSASSLSGDANATPSSPAPSAPGALPAPAPAKSAHDWIVEASHDFNDYQRLNAEGKFSEAGKKLEALKQALDKLNAQNK
jgi:hypothetical protein